MASASTLPNLYQGVEKKSFGYKLLANLGWKEGQGLGANKQGIKEHLKVKKKQDALGVGAAEHAHKLRDWTTGMVGYDAILTGLKEITRGGPSSSGGSGGSSDEKGSEQGGPSGYDSDSDTSGRAPAKPAAAKQDSQKKSKAAASAAAAEAKQKKRGKKQQRSSAADADAPAAKRVKKLDSSSSESDSDSDSDAGSDSDSDAEPAAAAAATGGISVPGKVSRVKAASHLGRYSKREKAKTVRNYSANDLAAILGLPGGAPPVANGEGAAGWAAAVAISNAAGAGAGSSSSDCGSSSSSDSDGEAGGERNSSDQRLRPSTPPGSDSPPSRSQQRGLGDNGKTLNPVVDEELQPVSDDADEAVGQRVWWRSVFVRAGRTGGGAPAAAAAAAAGGGKQRINISGFLEEDQTNLYMQAQEGATKGKQGLGRSTMPKKVAGTRWQGKKVRLGSDSEDEAEEEQQQEDAGAGEAAAAAAAATAAAAAARTYIKNGITIVMPVRREEQQQQQQEGAAAAAAGKTQEKEKKDKQSKQQQQQIDAAGSSKSKKDKKQKQEHAAAAVAAGAGSSKKRKQQQEDDAAAAAATPGSSQKKSKKAKQEQQQQQVPQVKWAKLAAKILEGAPKKRMRVQKLHRKVVAAAGYDVERPGVDTERLFAQMLRKLKKAEGLAVCEKYVGLAA